MYISNSKTAKFLSVVLVINITGGYVHVNGNCTGVPANHVTIKALLELHNSVDCLEATEQISKFSLNLALAAEYIINLMNSNGSEIAVPGITYNLDVYDVCSSQTLAAREAAVSLPESIWTQNRYCSSSYVNNAPLQLGFLGPGFSSNVPQVAAFLGDLDIPLVTPSATLAEFSDKTKYPSLLRTTVSDIIQSKAIADFMRKMKWSYVMLIHSDDSYGIQGAEEVQKEAKKSPTICFSSVVPVKSGQESSYYQRIAQKIVDDDATAILYFGHDLQASLILRFYMDNPRSINSKYILASDSISESQKLLRVFESSSKRNLELVTISSYFDSNQLTSFMDYKKQRLNSALNHRNTSNLDPYIHDYMSWCSSHPSCNSSQVEQDLINTIDYTLDMMHATIAMTSAFQRVHQSLCGSEVGVCAGLLDSNRFYKEMSSQVKAQRINITLGSQDFDFEFDANGDKRVKQIMPVYKLSGLKLSQNRYNYFEIGKYSLGAAWTTAGLPVNLGPSRCIQNCEKCIPARAAYIYTRRRSNYIVVATGPTSEQKDDHSCMDTISDGGFLRMEAFYFAMEYVRRLTEIDFSTLFIDTCHASLNTYVILNKIFGNSTYAHLIDTDGVEHDIPISDIVIIIGDQSSDISLALQNYLSLYKIPQISYGSSSPYLSDDVRYPYFLRTVPPDDQQAMYMIKLVQKLGLKEVGVIQQLDTVYALNGGNLVLKSAKELGVCVTFYRGFTKYNMSQLVADISVEGANGLPKGLILFAGELELIDLLEQLLKGDPYFRQRGHFFIGSDAWGDTSTSTQDTEKIVLGSLTFAFNTDVFNWTVSGVNQFKKYVSEQTPVNNKENPLFTRYWQQHFNCYLENEYISQSRTLCSNSCRIGDDSCYQTNDLFFDDLFSKNIFIAALSFSYAVRQKLFVEDRCRDTRTCQTNLGTEDARLRLFELLLETKVPTCINSSSQDYLPYQPNGDGKVTYVISNIVETPQGGAAYVRTYKIEDGKFTNLRQPIFYKDGKCYNASGIASEYCHSCPCLFDTGLGDSTTNANAESLNNIQLNQKILIAVLTMVAMGCFMSCVILLVLWVKNRKGRGLKDSSSTFSNLTEINQRQHLELREYFHGSEGHVSRAMTGSVGHIPGSPHGDHHSSRSNSHSLVVKPYTPNPSNTTDHHDREHPPSPDGYLRPDTYMYVPSSIAGNAMSELKLNGGNRTPEYLSINSNLQSLVSSSQANLDSLIISQSLTNPASSTSLSSTDRHIYTSAADPV